MSNVTRLPPFSKTVHVEADIPVSQRDELERAGPRGVIGIGSRIACGAVGGHQE